MEQSLGMGGRLVWWAWLGLMDVPLASLRLGWAQSLNAMAGGPLFW